MMPMKHLIKSNIKILTVSVNEISPFLNIPKRTMVAVVSQKFCNIFFSFDYIKSIKYIYIYKKYKKCKNINKKNEIIKKNIKKLQYGLINVDRSARTKAFLYKFMLA